MMPFIFIVVSYGATLCWNWNVVDIDYHNIVYLKRIKQKIRVLLHEVSLAEGAQGEAQREEHALQPGEGGSGGQLFRYFLEPPGAVGGIVTAELQ